MLTQSLVSVVFEIDENVEIDQPAAVKLDNGKLIPCDDADKFFGVVVPGMEPSVETLRTKVTSGPVIVTHKGIAKVAVAAGTYNKGTPLTIDTTNPGKLKVASNTDKIIAYAVDEVVATDNEVITVFIC